MDQQPMAASSDSGSSSSRSSTPAVETPLPPAGLVAEPAGVVCGGESRDYAAAFDAGPGGDGLSFLDELSFLENEAAAPTPTCSLSELCVALEDEGLEEACATVAGEPECREMSQQLAGAGADSTSPGAPPATPAAGTGLAAHSPSASSPPVPGEAVPLGTSWTWRYFRLPEGVADAREATAVICTLCGASVRRGQRGKAHRLGTTALASHLAHRHNIHQGQEPATASTSTTTAAAAEDTAAIAASTTRPQHRPGTSRAPQGLPAGRASATSTSTPRGDLNLSPPTDYVACLGICMVVCLQCGAKLSCGESRLWTLVQVVNRHIRRRHPELVTVYSAQEKAPRDKGGKRRRRDDGAGNQP